MNVIQQLRADVDLPAAYRVKMPIAERKKLLRNALGEQRLCNAMAHKTLKLLPPDTQKPRMKRDKFLAGCRRVKIVKHVTEFGPITSLEIDKTLGFGVKGIRGQLSILMKLGYVEKLTRKRKVNNRPLALYAVTDAGREYGERV